MNQSPSSPPSASPPERPEAGQTEVVVPIKGHWRWSALLGVLGMVMVCFVGTTLAVFVDIESGSFDVSVTVPPQVKLRPVASHLASTTLAIDDQGRAVIWGYRDQGISGTGVSTVGTSSDASIVALPEGRRIVLLTGGNEDGSTASVYYTKYTYVVALDDRGQVWTWGFDDNYMGGRTPTGDWPRNKPGPVVLPPPFDSSKDQVVDIKASTPTTVVLTKLGDVWIWGNDWHGTAGIGINVTGAGPQPRRILTGIHSIGTGYWAGWAVAAPDWTYTTYEDKDDFKGAQSAKKAQGGLLFWGWQQTGQSGGPAGDGRASADYRTPSLVAADSPLSLALAAGTAAGDDNATLGVRAGSADDKGTFQQMTGSYYGNQFRLRDGSVYLWGSRTNYAAGTDASTGSISAYIPQRVTLQHLGLPVQVVHIASTMNLVFLLDSTGTVWMYGKRSSSPQFPDASGAPQPTSASDVRLPMRIDGGDAYPGWKAGTIADIVGMGHTAAVRHKDGTVWMVGENERYMVRSHLDYNSNSFGTTDRALSQLNLTWLDTH